MTDLSTRALSRKLRLAKAAILFEQLWVALFPAMMVAGLALLLVLIGAPALLPAWAKYFAAGALAVAFLVALWPLTHLSWPSDSAALRRVEKRSRLDHRPATAWTDRIADPKAASATKTVWLVHKRRMAERLKSLRAGWPRSGLLVKDLYALRNALLLALLVAGLLNWGQWDRRVVEAVSGPVKAAALTEFDAWITPPAYTGKPPVLLSGAAAKARLEKTDQLLALV